MTASDVVSGRLHFWRIKDLFGFAHLDHITQIHISGVVLAAHGLLHVMRDDGDGVVLFKIMDQLFDGAC